MNKQFFFLHIPRTMGTALKVQCLATNFHPDEVMLDLRWTDSLSMSRERYKNVKLIAGHIGVNIASVLGYQVPIMTMLRDPFHRSMSMYRLCRLAKWHYLHDISSRVSFLEFIRHPETSRLITNAQARYIVSDIGYHSLASIVGCAPTRNNMDRAFDSISLPDDNTLLEQAKSKIDSFFFTGVADRFYDSINLLWDILGIDNPKLGPDMAIQMNPTLRSNIHPRITSEAYDALKKINQVDLELYRHAEKQIPKYTGGRFSKQEGEK